MHPGFVLEEDSKVFYIATGICLNVRAPSKVRADLGLLTLKGFGVDTGQV